MEKMRLVWIFLFFNLNLYSVEYIIKTKEANLRKLPDSKSEVVTKLYQYESIKIIEQKGNWFKVKNIDGYTGWVHKSVVEKLVDEEDENKKNTTSQKVHKQTQTDFQSPVENKSTSQDNIFILQPASQTQTAKPVENQTLVSSSNKDLSEKKKVSIFDLTKRRRVIGEHIFPATVLFPTPVPSARFGFSEGVGIVKGYYQYLYEDPDTNQTTFQKQNLNYFGFEQRFDSNIIITHNISVDFNLGIILSGGMENKDFTTLNASPSGEIRIGPNFAYKLNNNLLLSFSSRLYYNKSIKVSADSAINNFFEFLDKKINDPQFEELIENYDGSLEDLFNIINSPQITSILKEAIPIFTKSLVSNETSIGIAPSLGFAYPIKKYLGIQGSIEWLRTKDKTENKIETETTTESNINLNLASSIDFRHFIKFPLGSVIEYSRMGGDFPINNYGLGLYYQGIGDVQLGLFFSKSKIKQKNISDRSQTFVQFTLSYFF